MCDVFNMSVQSALKALEVRRQMSVESALMRTHKAAHVTLFGHSRCVLSWYDALPLSMASDSLLELFVKQDRAHLRFD